MNGLLQISHLTKRYGKTLAVNDVSLDVPPGIGVGLVGPNGSGKSTLIKCCVGIERPDDGQVLVAGLDLTGGTTEAKRHLAYAPELPMTVGGFTAWDHVAFTARVLELDGWEAEAERPFRDFDLWEKRNRMTGGFSKGELQKVMLTMALIRGARVLFLDEPLLGLDPRATLALKREIRAHLGRGGAALICSHVLPLVEELCSTLAVLSKGRLVFVGTPDGLRVAARDSPGASLEEAFIKITEPGAGSSAEEE